MSGVHTEGRSSQGFTTAKDPEHRITQRDIRETLARASDITMPPGQELIHILTNGYTLDGEELPREPVGIRGRQLQVQTYLVLASAACCQNIYDSIANAGYRVEGIALQSLASAAATLSPEEEKLGVVLIDIGGGITDLAVFQGQGVRYLSTVSVGGNHITNDLAVGLHTTTEKAEELKLRFATLSRQEGNDSEQITVPGVAGRDPRLIERADIHRIVRCRIEELIELVDASLTSNGCKHLAAAGAVITGGTALLPGLKEEAEGRLHLPARIGYPKADLGSAAPNPTYATAVGLLKWAYKARQENLRQERIDVRIMDWIRDFF
jgi:cell division protein FtsA